MTSTTTAATSTRAITRTPLHDGWQAIGVGGPIADGVAGRSVAATVPGSIHTDLLAAGLIPDAYLDDNERLVAWIGACDWRYSTTFSWAADGKDRTDLVFDGLDTVARIELNGRLIGETRNMHRSYRFDVRELLVEGDNELVVIFASPIRYADAASLEQGYRPHVNHHPYNSIRKMACSFGWDWGIDTATVGIWRPVRLESWSTARLAAVRPTATVDGSRGSVSIEVEIEAAPGDEARDRALRIVATVGDAEARLDIAPGETLVRVEVTLDDVERWWPRGHGEQPLYDVDVTLEGDDGSVDAWSGRVGFRTVRLDTEPDASGTPMTFIVNDRPVFIKGANWIPDDAFPHRVDRARYAARIAQAEQANINLLRVWGGGIYESDDFYAECDERGVLTWQDFLFACAAYDEGEPMRSEVEAEARDNITRLMPHPSLVLWNGNNENIWGFQEWGWEKRLRGLDWGLGYYLELLPALIGELDPTRPYTPGSPFSPDAQYYPNDEEHGSVHLWEQWNRQDYPTYRNYSPRFVSEFGWQGPPTFSTLRRSISDAPLTPESPGMLVHQKAQDGNVKLIDGLVDHLPLPDDLDDWHWAMSLNQAIAVQVGIEHFRSISPHCMGSIVWQLNDCWPVTSWAAVDGDGRAKPLLFSLAHAYADRLITVQPRDGGLMAAFVNDTDDTWAGDALVRRLSFSGEELAAESLSVSIAARGTQVVSLADAMATAGDVASEVLVVELGSTRALWFFAEYRDSALQPAGLSTDVARTADGYAVTVTARQLARDVALLVDKLDAAASVDDQLVTLLPGESVTFAVTSSLEIDADAFARAEVLRCANQLVAGS